METTPTGATGNVTPDQSIHTFPHPESAIQPQLDAEVSDNAAGLVMSVPGGAEPNPRLQTLPGKISSWAGNITGGIANLTKEFASSVTPDRARKAGAFIVAGFAATVGATKAVGAARHHLAQVRSHDSPIERLSNLIRR